jgi:hypothetical protein
VSEYVEEVEDIQKMSTVVSNGVCSISAQSVCWFCLLVSWGWFAETGADLGGLVYSETG